MFVIDSVYLSENACRTVVKNASEHHDELEAYRIFLVNATVICLDIARTIVLFVFLHSGLVVPCQKESG